jgi:hypothetical protein
MTLERWKGGTLYAYCDRCTRAMSTETVAYHDAVERLKAKGWEVISPMEHICKRCKDKR